MKTLPVPLSALKRARLAYDCLMRDDLPIDFDKVSELIQAVGQVVRSTDNKMLKAATNDD